MSTLIERLTDGLSYGTMGLLGSYNGDGDISLSDAATIALFTISRNHNSSGLDRVFGPGSSTHLAHEQIVAQGANIVTNGTFTTDLTGWGGAAWAWNAATTARHTAGTATALTQAAATVSIASSYMVTFDVSNMTAGTLTPSCGGQTGTAVAANATTITWYFTATATTALAFTPSSDFDGDIDNVVLKAQTTADLAMARRALAAEFGPYATNPSGYDGRNALFKCVFA